MAKEKKPYIPILVDKKAVALYMRDLGLKTPGRVFTAIDKGANQQEIDDLILQIITAQKDEAHRAIAVNEIPLPYATYGGPIIEQVAKDDMNLIALLPYVNRVALMPDAHRVKPGHVPVGGVVLTRDCILPGVVGNDIACSVAYTTTDHMVDAAWFEDHADALAYIVREYTYFGQQMNPTELYGTPSVFNTVMADRSTPLLNGENVFDLLRIRESQTLLRGLLGVARNHFGTSGDGNHFVELGISTLTASQSTPKKLTGNQTALAILSHFGSRGVGSNIADYYLKVANDLHKMPKDLEDNAPLFFGDDQGWAEDYLVMMQWAGAFAQASHVWLHKRLQAELVARNLLPSRHESANIYTRHNYAWAIPEGIIHRKGATPAEHRQYGVIPATMGHASKIVMGLGNEDYLLSASHGAGRVMSRGVALRQITGSTHDYVKKEYGIMLIGGDRDEDPRAYKDINAVMSYQAESVQQIGEFAPVIVRMADPRFKWK